MRTLTLFQFESKWMRDCLAEYPTISKAEYLESYPPGSRAELWRKHLTEQATSGACFPNAVCRDIVKRFDQKALYFFAKHYPGSVPLNISILDGKTIKYQ